MLDKIKKLKQELIQLKTSQPTIDDSYKFYKYTSHNLFEQHHCRQDDFSCGAYYYEIEFIPYHNKENCIIQWFFFDPVPIQFYNSLLIDGLNPLKCVAQNLGWTVYTDTYPPTPPAAYQEQYVSCITNVEGHLKLTRKNGSP